MKRMNEEQFETKDQKGRDAAGELTVKKSRLLDNVAKVVTLVLAVTIWLYVVATNVVEKPLPLAFKEKNGLDFSDRVTLEYQSLIVRGASALVDPLQQLQLEDFSAKTLNDEDGDGLVEIELGLKEETLPDGISEILKANGSSFAGGKVKVKATVKVGHKHVITVPKSFVKVSNSNYEMAEDFVTLTIRSLSPEDDHTLFNQLNAYLDPNNTETQNEVISIFANVEEKTVTAKMEVPISITFKGEYKDKVYEVLNSDGTPYTIMVQKVAK